MTPRRNDGFPEKIEKCEKVEVEVQSMKRRKRLYALSRAAEVFQEFVGLCRQSYELIKQTVSASSSGGEQVTTLQKL